MLETPSQTLRALLALGFAHDEVDAGARGRLRLPSGAGPFRCAEVARARQEEDIAFAHTVIEHDAAIKAEWRE